MLKLYTDASTKGNPGPSGAGVVVIGENIYDQLAFPLTNLLDNHEAEFEALICGLTYLKEQNMQAGTLMIYTDSQIVARAVERNYAKKANYQLYLSQIRSLLAPFELTFINWVAENQNKGADHMARQALQERLKSIEEKSSID
ncbi:ribonuclease HI family protein [Carnobacterium maltaromaticum]|uniref:ribonuclease HI family protein n=1 Tax=Carnobacterium maltaromaticum TaxID=2751 RepID=UPI0012F8478E|nr:ribonuclease HI family protein [Carnobacterium maltaromaticum]